MIIVQIIGGLGNQMFQYAFGRRLADGLGVPLKLDITAFGSFYDKRPYALGALRIEEDFASAHDIAVTLRGRFAWARSRLQRTSLRCRRTPGVWSARRGSPSTRRCWR